MLLDVSHKPKIRKEINALQWNQNKIGKNKK